MSIEFFLFRNPLYIEPPAGITGWLAWLFLFAIDVILLKRWWGFHKKRWTGQLWGILIGLTILAPLASLFIVLRLPAGEALPPPGLPVEPKGPAMVLFSALPWMLAAGLLGPGPAAGLGAFAGLALAIWDTHNPYTPLEFALVAILFSALVLQRYRTLFYRILAHPLVAALLLAVLYPILYLVDTLFATAGSLANRVDYAFTQVGFSGIAVAGGLLVSGLFAEVIAAAAPALWGSRTPLQPSPAERKLETRFLYTMAPLALILLVALMVGDWLVAGSSARQMLRERMASTAEMTSETIPFFLEAGQNYIQQLAKDPRLYTLPTDQLSPVLAQDLRSVPFFRQLFILDEQGHSLSGYPLGDYAHSFPPPEELVGVELALNGVPIQNYTIPPVEGDSAAQVSFLADVTDETGKLQRILIGRSDLASNPLTKPVLSAIRDMVGSDGEGMLLDSNNRILYHPNPARLMESYTGRTGEQILFYDEAAPDSTRRLVYYQPVLGQSWSVVLAIPARRSQQLALNIAVPLLGMVLLLFVAGVIVLRFGLRVVTASLQNLGAEAKRIADGQLDHPLPLDGEDEVGQLRRAFEQMRISLKSRLDELNMLLNVSQGVASSLEIKDAIKPILDSALVTGACSARLVLLPVSASGLDSDNGHLEYFGHGNSTDQYQYLDEQILELTQKQEKLVLNNLARVRLLTFIPGRPRPEALLALALRHENMYYGTLWLAYDRPHTFIEDELRFMITLAGQAALAAANTRLFQSAEIGRQRLAAILASTPDPVLVTDQQNHLLLSNPAAWQVLGMGTESGDGRAIETVINQKDLVKLLRSSEEERKSAEVTLLNGRVYLATTSSVFADGLRVGRVCVLRDITHFKELDKLKSEFVATVSHDLRSPLTLMRGYATMLEMVGELNEQQTNYVRKIVIAVESMTKLVNNLLDLGRIEAGIDLQLEMVLVQDVVEKVTGALQPTATQKQITLSTEVPPATIPLVEADPALLQQALSNLIENSIKYTERGGKVNVSVQARADGMVFAVSDTGIGIAPVDQPRLFEKFYRGAQRDTKKPAGTGLGLTIVKSIAERHGGKVWVESQLGKGSTFYFVIPLNHSQKETPIAKEIKTLKE